MIISMLVGTAEAMDEAKKQSHSSSTSTKSSSYGSLLKEHAVPIVLTAAVVGGGIVYLSLRKGSSDSSDKVPGKGIATSLIKYTGKKVIDKTVTGLLYVGLPLAAFWRYQNGRAAAETRKHNDVVVNIHKKQTEDFKETTQKVVALTKEVDDLSGKVEALHTEAQHLSTRMSEIEKNTDFEPFFTSILGTKESAHKTQDFLTSLNFIGTQEQLQNLFKGVASFEDLFMRIDSLDTSFKASIMISENTGAELDKIRTIIENNHKKRNDKKQAKLQASAVGEQLIVHIPGLSHYLKEKK